MKLGVIERVPCRSRFPVLGSVTVAYETVPGSGVRPLMGSKKEMVPVGAIVALSPRTVAINVVLEPAFTGLGDACRFTVGFANLTKNVVPEEVEG